MRLRFVWQSAYALMISVIVTMLVAMCFSGLFGSFGDLTADGLSPKTQWAVIKDGKAIFASCDFTEFDIQNLVIALKSSKMTYELNDTEYRTHKQNNADGSVSVTLYPKSSYAEAYKRLAVAYFIIFAAVYFAVCFFMQRKNERDIINPIIHIKNQTELLCGGDFEINIPDEGKGEINELAKSIEALRLRLKEEVYINKKANENRKFLISSMSHDLRTPVTSLRGYIEGILDGVAQTDEKREAYLKKCLEKTDLINQMIGDLLLYSKLDLNQVEFNFKEVDIAEYLLGFVLDSENLFKKQNKTIEFTNKLTAKYNVRIDVLQFGRVMGNLTSNALKYIPEHTGIVQIILRENTSSVLVEVKDNGTGIEKDDLNKIFDRFYRCEKSRKIQGSSGLGLAISKQIIENTGGRIWAVSTIGEGTSVMISLKKIYRGHIKNEKNTDN